ncbi:MAG: hypothetical protein LUF92_12490 [Clostridiales bacterium]|nr:hypothetical protein [Clostridiales bacterium]
MPVQAFTDVDDSSEFGDVSVDIEDPISEISPEWQTTDHKNKQCDYVIDELNLTEAQGSWLKESCSIVDSEFRDIKMFHVTKKCNYVAGLNALFMFARLIGTSNKKQTILESMPDLSEENVTYISEMCDAVQSYLTSKESISKTHKQYLVYGFALHLMGDVYAHRVKVKKTCITNWGLTDTSSKKYFQTEDFKSSTLSEFKQKVLSGDIYTADIKNYMLDSGNVFKLNYTISESKTTTTPGLVYTDNTTFMPKRFTAAKEASVSFVKNVRNSNKDFNDVDFYLDDYSLTLYKFSEYQSVI